MKAYTYNPLYNDHKTHWPHRSVQSELVSYTSAVYSISLTSKREGKKIHRILAIVEQKSVSFLQYQEQSRKLNTQNWPLPPPTKPHPPTHNTKQASYKLTKANTQLLYYIDLNMHICFEFGKRRLLTQGTYAQSCSIYYKYYILYQNTAFYLTFL